MPTLLQVGGSLAGRSVAADDQTPSAGQAIRNGSSEMKLTENIFHSISAEGK
jgi:hypothetical protein